MGIRDIIFRGKRTDNGEWVEGNLFIPDSDSRPTQILMGTDIVRISYEIDPETVGQYTGLIDKNGKKIFENDILKLTQTKNGSCGSCYLGIVKFGEYIDDSDLNNVKEHIGFYIEETYGITGILTPRHDGWDSCEVIGNIFDNPELLK